MDPAEQLCTTLAQGKGKVNNNNHIIHLLGKLPTPTHIAGLILMPQHTLYEEPEKAK